MPVPPKIWLRSGALPVGLLLGYLAAPEKAHHDSGDTPAVVSQDGSAAAEKSLDGILRSMIDPENSYSSQARILAYAKQLDHEGLARAARMALEMPGTEGSRNELVKVLVPLWGQSDPEACIAFCVSLEKVDYGVVAAFAELAKTDHSRAVQLIGTIGDPGVTSRAWQFVLREMVKNSPREAMALARGPAQDAHEAVSAYGTALGTLYYRYAESDPEAAVEALQKEDAEFVEKHLSLIADMMSGTDPEIALAWVMELPETSGRERAFRKIMAKLAVTDPASAAKALDSNPREPNRNSLVEKLATEWAQKDPAALEKWAATLPSVERGIAVGKLVGSLVLSDLKAAKALALSIPEGQGRSAAQAAGIDALKRTDPFAAAAWYAEASAGKGINIPGTYRAGSVVDDVVRADPERALLWSLGLGGNDALNIPRKVLGKWMTRDPEAVANSVASIENGELRERALANYGAVLAQRDPGGAVGWADSLSGDERFRALASIGQMGRGEETLAAFERLQELATTDSQKEQILGAATTRASSFSGRRDADDALAGWVRELEWPDLQESFAHRMVGSWALSDPRAAGEWVDSLAEGKGRDAGADQLARVVAANDPPGAWAWALAIGDSDMRTIRATNVAETWATTDQAAAVQAVVESNLPEETKAAVLEILVP